MSVLSKTAAKALVASSITTNGAETNTAAGVRTPLDSIIDSYQDAIPQLTTAQINALTPTLNQLVFNTDRNYLMQYNGTIWVSLVAMFIGTAAQVAGATPKEGQLFYSTDTKVLSYGDGVTSEAIQKADACTCVKTVKVSLSSAQILNSNTTPIQLIAAPGAGKIIVCESIIINSTFVTTPYSTNLDGLFTLGSGSVLSISNMLDFSSNNIKQRRGTMGSENPSDVVNEALSYTTQTGDPTAGDGTIDLYITYQVITL